MNKENLILDLSFKFALEIIKFTENLESIKKYNLSNQLFRSGTSIGANIREAQSAESKVDFIHKVKIATKKPMKQNIGCYYVSIQKVIQIAETYWMRS